MFSDLYVTTGERQCVIHKNNTEIMVIESIEKAKYLSKTYCRTIFNGKYPQFVKLFVEGDYSRYICMVCKENDKYVVYMRSPRVYHHPYSWLYDDYDFSGDLLRSCIEHGVPEYMSTETSNLWETIRSINHVEKEKPLKISAETSTKVEEKGLKDPTINVRFHKLSDDLYELDPNEINIKMKLKIMNNYVRVISKQRCKMLLILVAKYLGGSVGHYKNPDDISIDDVTSVINILDTKSITLIRPLTI